MAAEQVNVSIAEDYRDRFPEVIERVKQAGLEVEHELADIGVVTGTIDSARLAALERVEGVAAAEVGRQIRIAPPESEIQ